MRISTKKVVYGGLLIAIGLMLPQVFHIFGSEAGKTFLPMHIPVILSGMLLGPLWGLMAALIIPLLSSLMFSMPAVPMLWFMLFELGTYAVVSGLLAKRKWNVYLNLAVTIPCGRIVYGLSLIAGVRLLQVDAPFANMAAFTAGIVQGLPGVAIQLVVIPLVMLALKKGGLLLDKA